MVSQLSSLRPQGPLIPGVCCCTKVSDAGVLSIGRGAWYGSLRSQGRQKRVQDFKHGFAISQHHSPEGCYQFYLPPQSEGAGNAGRRCAAAKSVHVVATVTPETPGIPRAMVYGLLRALPGDRALLPPSSAVARQLDTR